MRINKKGLGSIIVIGIILFIIMKLNSSLLFYKQAFNLNIYDKLVNIKLQSQNISNATEQLLKGNDTIENIINARTSYEGVLQEIQELNSNIYRLSEKHTIKIEYFTVFNIPTIYSQMNNIEDNKEVILSDEEKVVYTEVNDTFKNLSDILSENLDDVERDSWGTPKVVENKLYFKIIDEINTKLEELSINRS